jgi:Leu/Phe-tRNA-protein transferase
MMFWLIRATQVTRLVYQLVLATMMTTHLLREGVRNTKKRKFQKQLRTSRTSP